MAVQPIWWLMKTQYQKMTTSMHIARNLVPPPNNPSAGVYAVLILASSVTPGTKFSTTTSPSEAENVYSPERDEDIFHGRTPPVSARDALVLVGYDEHAIVDLSAYTAEMGMGNERHLQFWISGSPNDAEEATAIAVAIVRRMRAFKFHADAEAEVIGFGDIFLLPLPWYTRSVRVRKVDAPDDIEASIAQGQHDGW